MFEVLKIEKDYEGAFFITVDGQEAWELSGELIKQLLKEIRNISMENLVPLPVFY